MKAMGKVCMLRYTVRFLKQMILPFHKKKRIAEEKLSLLPFDIFKIILSNLAFKDIFALAGASKGFHFLIERYLAEHVIFQDANVKIGDGYTIITCGNENFKRGTYNEVNQILKQQFSLNHKIKKMEMSFSRKFLTYFNDIIKELMEDKDHGYPSQVGLVAAIIAIDIFLSFGEKLALPNDAAIMMGAKVGYTFGEILQTNACALFNYVKKIKNDELLKSENQLANLPKIIYDSNRLKVTT